MDLNIWLIVILFIVLPWLTPPVGDRGFVLIENYFSKIASKRTACVVGIFIVTILIRIALLPLFPYPRPTIHDEFAYLLQADMFAHGRLCFPPHPMSAYFETFYVNFHPTYSAMYPPAQASVLAVGYLVGNSWIGVLMSTAAMIAAILWMLQGWFHPRWALLGAVLVMVRIGILSYWMNSYWGGSVAAAAAALVLGALPRLKRHLRARDALALGLGIIILANSRPLEGLIFCIPVAVFLLIWLTQLARNRHWNAIRIVFSPILVCLLANLLFTLYYNSRVTGDPLVVPHAIYYKQYMSVPPVLWGRMLPPMHYANVQFDQFYNGWNRAQYNGTWEDAMRIEWHKARDFWIFFLGAGFSLPFIMVPSLLRDRRIRAVLFHFLFCALGLLAMTWFLPHYAAPAFSILVIIIVQAVRHLRRCQFHGRPIGITCTRLLTLFVLLTLPLCVMTRIQNPHVNLCLGHAPFDYDWARACVVSRLKSLPGEHLVVVRYSSTHDTHHEWVYNEADIDKSKIVWAREVAGQDITPLLSYYPKRTVWVVEPDANPTKLYQYFSRSE